MTKNVYLCPSSHFYSPFHTPVCNFSIVIYLKCFTFDLMITTQTCIAFACKLIAALGAFKVFLIVSPATYERKRLKLVTIEAGGMIQR